jgi:malate permease and related proteins
MFEQSFSILVGRLAGLFMLAWLGWILIKRSILEQSVAKGLAWIVVDVTLPVLIFIGMISLSVDSLPWQGLLLGGFLLSSLGLLLGALALRWKSIKNKGTFLFSVAIANSSFLPLPLAMALWGELGTAACLIHVLGNNVFLFSVGISLFRLDGHGLKNIDFSMLYQHPQAIAAALGLLWRWGGLPLPSWLYVTLDGLGQSTIPLAMLATGGLLAASGRKMIENKGVLGLSLALKLLVLPALTLLVLKSLEITGILAGILLLQACMPSLASAAAYASRFKGDPVLAGNSSFWSSLAALGTIPAWMALGSAFGLY